MNPEAKVCKRQARYLVQYNSIRISSRLAKYAAYRTAHNAPYCFVLVLQHFNLEQFKPSYYIKK